MDYYGRYMLRYWSRRPVASTLGSGKSGQGMGHRQVENSAGLMGQQMHLRCTRAMHFASSSDMAVVSSREMRRGFEFGMIEKRRYSNFRFLKICLAGFQLF